MTRVFVAFGLMGLLAACGVDGEPSTPLAMTKLDTSYASIVQPSAPIF